MRDKESVMRGKDHDAGLRGTVLICGGILCAALLAGLGLGVWARGGQATEAASTTTPTTVQATPPAAAAAAGGGLGVEGGAWTFSRVVAKAGVGVAFLLAFAATVQWMVYRHTRVPVDNESGLVPLTAQQRRDSAPSALRAFHGTAKAAVSNASGLPQAITHLNIRDSQLAEITAASAEGPATVKAPTFPQLMKDGALVKGATPIAWTENGMIQGTTKEIRSGGVLAQSGGGKSVLFAEQIAWKRYCGAAVFLGDLHAHLDDSTTARLGPMADLLHAPVAGTKTELLDMVWYLRDAWEAVMEGRPHELAGREVHICLDEFTGLASRDALVVPTVDLTARVGSEGGKARWCIWIGGQQGTKAATGGGQARDSLKTRLVMGAERADAGRWLDVSTRILPENMKYLDPGECYMMTRGGLVHAQVPWLPEGTLEDMAEAIEARERVEGAHVLRPDPAALDAAQAAIERGV